MLENFIERNSELCTRVRELENGQPLERQVSTTRGSIRSWTSSRITFETVLSNSRIYRRVRRSGASQPGSAGWSSLSGLSLSDISNLSVFHLGICSAELSNPECYRETYSSLRMTSIPEPESPITTVRTPGEWTPPNSDLADELGRLLRLACSSGNDDGVYELITTGIDVEEVDEAGLTPLQLAATSGYHAIVQLLIVFYGANKEGRDGLGNTPLLNGANRGYVETVRVLVELGAHLEVTGNDEQTPLIAAASAGHHAIVRVLLQQGANIEHQDSSGNTALHYAVRHGHSLTVFALQGIQCEMWAVSGDSEAV